MKHINRTPHLTLLLCTMALLLASCGTDSRHFKIDGRLLNLNQGEFYVYSPDGDMRQLDTIKVQAGRFTYTTECTQPKTLMIVFPNFTEQPVFAEPGKSVDIKGDASHLKEMTVKGTKDNELMNRFRKQIHSASPPEMLKRAGQFVQDHPESAVAPYLVRHYFIETYNPDFATAARLLNTISASQPDNAYVQRLKGMIEGRNAGNGNNVPRFTATDINGSTVSNSFLSSAPTVVVVAWATWNYSSINMLRTAAQRASDSQGRIKVLGICLDPDKRSCRHTLDINNITGVTVVCDGRMVDSPVYNSFGMSSLPDNVVLKGGRITNRSLSVSDMQDKL